jgi:hypothetical protein
MYAQLPSIALGYAVVTRDPSNMSREGSFTKEKEGIYS